MENLPDVSETVPSLNWVPTEVKTYLPLICLALTHTVVDACALLIAPLWPGLEAKFALSTAALSVAFIVQSLPTSISQVIFGYLRDRQSTPVWLWVGPVLAAIFLPLMGVASSMSVLFVLLIIGGIGVGAFHPEAAVAAGKLIPENRTRALSIFMLGGSLGLGLGPLVSGIVVSQWGFDGLAYVAIPAIGLIFLLRRVGRLSQVIKPEATSTKSLRLSEMMHGRLRLAIFLFLICSLRLVPNMATDKVIAFTMQQRGHDEMTIGMYQMLFLISASIGMSGMAFYFRSGWEKPFMIGCPLAGIPLLYVLGLESCPHWLFVSSLMLLGIALWGTSPAMVSYAQQQFPRGAGIASAITMGLSWGMGGLLQAPVTAYYQSVGTPQLAFHAFIGCLVLASVGACFLPSTTAIPSPAKATAAQSLATAHPEPADI